MNFLMVLWVGLQCVIVAFPGSNSLTFWYILNMNFLMVLWFGLQSVLVAFPGQTHLSLVHSVYEFPHSAVGWSAVCDCGVSWSNSITFWYILNMNFLMLLWVGLQCVIVAFSGQTHLLFSTHCI